MGASKNLFTEMREQGVDVDCDGNIYEEPQPISNIDRALLYYHEMNRTWHKIKELINNQK